MHVPIYSGEGGSFSKLIYSRELGADFQEQRQNQGAVSCDSLSSQIAAAGREELLINHTQVSQVQ